MLTTPIHRLIRRLSITLLAIPLVAASRAAPTAGDPGPSPTLGARPPRIDDDRTVVLFDGRDWSPWRQRDGSPSGWEVLPDGSVRVKGGDAVSRIECADFQLHLEFLCPHMPDKTGQGRANSGVYLHGRYEVQVLDSWGLESKANDCGAVYSIAPPLVNACRPPDRWQTYDITFRAPRIDAEGAVTEPARVTVLHNGIAIHANQVVERATLAGLAQDIVAEGPLLLQDHGNPVRYRNIWLRRLGP